MKNFVHLHLHSEFSLQDGVASVDEYIKKAKEYNMDAIALTDTSNMFGAMDFYIKAKKNNIKAIIGCEMNLSQFDMTISDGENFRIVLLAKNLCGYKNLIKLTTLSYKKGFFKEARIDKQTLKKYSDGLIALSSSKKGEIEKTILNSFYNNSYDEEKIIQKINEYIEIFGKDNFYLEIQATNDEEQKFINNIFYDLSIKYSYNLVATNNVYYLNQGDYDLQDLVICIQNGKLQKDKNRETCVKDLYFKNREEIEKSLDEKFIVAIENSLKISDMCNLDIKLGELQFPSYTVPDEFQGTEDYLRYLCEKNAKQIYGENIPKEVKERLYYELDVINKMGYSGYFIIVWDFVFYARNNNIPIGPGRGSAAGSLVSYILGITKIDPLKYHLLFERFLNPERISMPDIDIDIDQEKRQDLIDYVAKKYGIDKVAHIITFGTMKAKAAIRDVGRVLDVPLSKIDKLTKLISSSQTIEESLNKNKEFFRMYSEDFSVRKVLDSAMNLEGRVRHASTHAAGVLITKDNLDEHVPIYLDIKEGISATQYQMKELEALGLLKMDFLGLRNLTIVRRCLEFIKEDLGKEIDLYKLDMNDKEVYRALSNGDTLGVFQMEARGFINVLKKLKPDKFEDIMAMLSLYRPGPLNSGMVDQFINCKNGREKIKYLHPSLEEVLKETYGVILYQEQVMKIANIMANYSLGEADLLRRAMGKKDFNIMNENKEKFIKRSIENGYLEKTANEIFDLIYKFAGYGFNKSHSAAYAMLSYFTAYLKVHYKTFYYAALMTSDISNLDNIAIYVNDARKHGVKILMPDVNKPSDIFRVKNDVIVFSLAAIKNVGTKLAKNIKDDFSKNGKYKDILEFCLRTIDLGLNKKSLEALIYSGALDSLNGNRREKIESVEKLLDRVSKIKKEDSIQQLRIFAKDEKIVDTFSLSIKEEFSSDEIIKKEIEHLGFFTSEYPLDKYMKYLELCNFNIIDINDLEENKIYNFYGIIKNLEIKNTKNNNKIAFFNLDCYGKNEKVIVFPKDFKKYSNFIKEDNIIYMKAKVTVDEYKGYKTKKLALFYLNELKNMFFDNNADLMILLEEKDREIYSDLKKLFLNNLGKSKVIFYNSTNTKKFSVSDFNIKLSYKFLYQLMKIIDKNKIRIKLK